MLQDALKNEMQEKDLSVRQAALEIGISHSTVFRVLRGDPFDVPTLVRISNWLGVRPSTLLDNIAKSGTIEQVSMLIESSPGILSVLDQAVKAVREQKADPAIVEDIISYAVYKLSLEEEKDAKSQPSRGKITGQGG